MRFPFVQFSFITHLWDISIFFVLRASCITTGEHVLFIFIVDLPRVERTCLGDPIRAQVKFSARSEKVFMLLRKLLFSWADCLVIDLRPLSKRFRIN